MTETAKKVSVSTTKQIAVKETTLDSLKAAGAKVGAPSSASLAIGGAPYLPPTPDGGVDEDHLPFTVTFTWTEEV